MLAAIVAAVISSLTVAPAMTVIDTAIIRAQFAKESLVGGQQQSGQAWLAGWLTD